MYDVEYLRALENEHADRFRYVPCLSEESAPGYRHGLVTDVTEIFDYGTAKVPLMITAFGYDKKNAEGITATLQRLAERFG